MSARLAALLCGLLFAFPLLAQDEGEAANDAALREFIDSLQYREGSIAVGAAHARFELGSQFRYLEQGDARRVLEDLWGNPPDDSVLGLIQPADIGLDDERVWAVVVTYSDDGHVADEDAASIDYAELLQTMQEETAAENEARLEAGFSSIALAGWAESPRYDPASHKLYWAKELVFDGEQRALNYDVRVLGRHGYLSLNAVADIEQLPAVREGMSALLPLSEFDDGFRYADFDSSTDKLAAYGLAALVAGGVASKAGLFGKLFAALLAAKKIVLPLLVGLVALIASRFKKKA